MKELHTFVVLAYKESKYLEDCIKSVLNQKYKSNVIIATSTPNSYIKSIADKYMLSIIQNPNPGKGIGYDFDFALSCGFTPLITIAHQDDIYDYEYSENVVKKYLKNKETLIIITDYYEIRKNNKVFSNTNLKIKKILLAPLRINIFSKTKFGKRLSIRFGNSICCPAVTFAIENVKTKDIFKCNFKCNVDWYAWEKLSLMNGSFSYIAKVLMGHRVHEDSTTTEIINNNIRTKEDLIMFDKFWPTSITKFINILYKQSEKSNR